MTTPPESGDVLAEKYRVERVLGAGGMGVVLEATHLTLGERVAIKVLRQSGLDDARRGARFVREAQAAARIRSEHAVRVYDVGTLEDGSPFMVMEHLDGDDLGQHVKQHGPLAPELAAEALLQACGALAAAHHLDIVHRDIKPSNLFYCRRAGRHDVKVIDFGISKVPVRHDVTQSSPDAEMTASNAMIGSPHFMAPEQMRSAKHVDARADIWSLGATFHTLLTGETPFRGDSVMGIYESILDGYRGFDAPTLETAPHEAIVRRCLRRDPDERYQNVAELALELAPLAPPRARHLVDRIEDTLGERRRAGTPPARTRTPHVSDTVIAPTEPMAPAHATQEAWSGPRSKPGRRAAALTLAAGGAIVVAWLAGARSSEPVSPALDSGEVAPSVTAVVTAAAAVSASGEAPEAASAAPSASIERSSAPPMPAVRPRARPASSTDKPKWDTPWP